MLATELEQAMVDGDLRLYYQPQIHLVTGKVVGVEALLRWTGHAPDEFIPVAEMSGLIVPLGTWVLEQACEQLALWDEIVGMPRLHMAVNFSRRQLDRNFVNEVTDTLARFELAPERLSLELTETVLMTSGAAAVQELVALKDLGAFITIDDFGTGYSSLAYLRELPIEIIKIDRSFVSGLQTRDRGIVDAIMALASAMGLHVIAEGIETPVQACGLQALGCKVGQGFLFAPALHPTDIPTFALRRFDPKSWCNAPPGLDPPEATAMGGVIGVARRLMRDAREEWHHHPVGRHAPTPRPAPWEQTG